MQSGFVPSMTALSVPQHKPMCTIAFGGSTWTDDIALGLRRKKSFSLQQRELVETSAALSTTCLSTSVPHSLGTCLETGIYTTGGGAIVYSWFNFNPGQRLVKFTRCIERVAVISEAPGLGWADSCEL